MHTAFTPKFTSWSAKDTLFSHLTTLCNDFCRRAPLVAIVNIDNTTDDTPKLLFLQSFVLLFLCHSFLTKTYYVPCSTCQFGQIWILSSIPPLDLLIQTNLNPLLCSLCQSCSSSPLLPPPHFLWACSEYHAEQAAWCGCRLLLRVAPWS